MKKLHILVPLDGSKASEAVLPLVEAAGASKATLLHASDGDAVADAWFEGVASRLRGAGVGEVVRASRPGSVVEAITGAGLAEKADLIALSAHGRSGWSPFAMGSTAEKVVRTSTLPVLVAPEGAGSKSPGPLLGKVLAPQDGSELAERALSRLAGCFDVSRIGALSLLGIVEAYAGPGDLKGGDDVVSKYYRYMAGELKVQLSAIAGRAASLGLKPSVEVDLGKPAAKILDRGAAWGATLIVMSTHGRSGLSRWTLGSVADQVLHASPVPVLLSR
jgi:nucleotide-binding universal stress UspA family protein